MWDFTQIFRAIAEVAGIWKSERDPDENKKRERLKLKKKINRLRKKLAQKSNQLANAVGSDNEKKIQKYMFEQRKLIDELETLQKMLNELK